jgi:hypothetical protein
MDLATGHGILFPTALLHTPLFAVLAAFVAINTVMYASLAVAKVLPKIYVSDLWTSANRRVQNRGIHHADMAAAGASGRSPDLPREPAPAVMPAADLDQEEVDAVA